MLKRAWRAAQVVLVCDAEGGANVDLCLLNRYFVERRKLRQLGEQSKGGTRNDVLQRCRGQVVAAALRWLV